MFHVRVDRAADDGAGADDGDLDDEVFQAAGLGAQQGLDLGLQVNAGHGLNYHNVQAIAAIPGIAELNIGHAIVARALFSGLQESVREMKRLMREARAQ